MTDARGEKVVDESDLPVRRVLHDVGNDLAAIRLRADLVAQILTRTLGHEALAQALDDLSQILEAAGHARSQLEALAGASDVTMAEHGGATVLYVEDNDANIRLMTRIFRERPALKLEVASDGATALELAGDRDLRLALVDLNLPDTSGEELIPRLQERFSRTDLPVVVLSADATSERIHSLGRLPIAAYLTKPYDIAELLAIVDSYCGSGPAS